MRNLKLKTILEFYDIPQILVAIDELGIHYLCVLYDQLNTGELKYLGIQLSTNKLASFINGKEDLRTIFVNPILKDTTYDIIFSEGQLNAEILPQNLITEEMLPLEGYYYDNSSQEEDEIIIAETLANNHPIIRLGFEDSSNSHTIEASCLSQALAHYQAMVSNCYKKLIGKDLQNKSELRVTTFQAASFDVHLQVNANLNLFGSSDLEGVFRKIDNLFNAPNEDVFKETIQFLSGHTINSYKNFLEVLIENKLSIKYKWVASIADNEVVNGKMSLPKIERIYDLLLKNQEIQSEEKTYEGIFLASSVENGKWVFRPNNERKNINGCSENFEILSGVVIEQQEYKIICSEIQEQNIISLKITKKLILKRIENLDLIENN